MADQLMPQRNVWSVLVRATDGTVYVESVYADPTEAHDREAELKSEYLDRTDLREVWTQKTKLFNVTQLLDMRQKYTGS